MFILYDCKNDMQFSGLTTIRCYALDFIYSSFIYLITLIGRYLIPILVLVD